MISDLSLKTMFHIHLNSIELTYIPSTSEEVNCHLNHMTIRFVDS